MFFVRISEKHKCMNGHFDQFNASMQEKKVDGTSPLISVLGRI